MNNRYNFLRIGTALAILYSIAIVASATPAFGGIPNVIVILYYLIVPGYILVLYLGEDYAILQRIALSTVIGLAIVLIVFSLRQDYSDSFPLPFNVAIPSVAIVLYLFNFLRLKSKTVPSVS